MIVGSACLTGPLGDLEVGAEAIMTRQADFKRRVRARMAKTGESYAAARAQLLAARDPVDGDHLAALHVTNGDSAADLLRATGLVRRVLPWSDVLHEGPVPDVPDDELRRVRAAFLSDGDPAELRHGLLRWLQRRDHELAANSCAPSAKMPNAASDARPPGSLSNDCRTPPAGRRTPSDPTAWPDSSRTGPLLGARRRRRPRGANGPPRAWRVCRATYAIPARCRQATPREAGSRTAGRPPCRRQRRRARR